MDRRRLQRVRQHVHRYSRIQPSGHREGLFIVARLVLQGLAATLRARRAILWLSHGSLSRSRSPVVTVPGTLTPRQVRAARAVAQRALSGKAPPAATWATLVVRDGAAPVGVVAVARAHGEPFSADDRQFLAGLMPLLHTVLSGWIASEEAAIVVQDTDPVRATMDLLAELAHEMRTPLAIIKGHATALLGQRRIWPGSRIHKTLRIIDQEASTLSTLISELLAGAALDHGRLTIRPEPVLLNRLIERLVAEFARQNGRHRFKAAFPRRWPVIQGDPHRLEQVFRNVLDNAVKYSPKGGQITVTGMASRREVVVSVADQGVGIAPEDLNRLFEKFFRARKAAKVVGTGLGLPIARAIVEQHGGRIWAESTLGRGTTVHVALPRGPRHRGTNR